VRRISAGTVATALLLAACGASPRSSDLAGKTPSPLPSPAGSPVGQPIAVGNEPGEITIVAGSVWVTSISALIRIDPQKSQVVARIDLVRGDGALLGGGRQIAEGRDGLWVTCACPSYPDPRFANGATGGVVLIDPKAGRIIKTRVFGDRTPEGIAVDQSSVWLGTDKGITRLDAASLRVMQTVKISALNLSACCGSIWAMASDERGSFVARIDSESGRIVARIPISKGSNQVVTATVGGVWVVSDELVYRIDPGANRITATVRLPDRGFDLAVGEGSVWIVGFHAGTLTQIDASSLRIVSVMGVGDYPASVTVAEREVWVVNYHPGTVRRIRL
jgi:streptogramin lyase